jgi:hypothetical protein
VTQNNKTGNQPETIEMLDRQEPAPVMECGPETGAGRAGGLLVRGLLVRGLLAGVRPVRGVGVGAHGGCLSSVQLLVSMDPLSADPAP